MNKNAIADANNAAWWLGLCLAVAAALWLMGCAPSAGTVAEPAAAMSSQAAEATASQAATEIPQQQAPAPAATATSLPATPTHTAVPPTNTPTVAPPAEVTVTHRSGETTVPLNPETVVVMDVGILLSLDDLGIEVAAVGALPIPIPDEYAELVNSPDYAEIGTAFEPDIEAINALAPDLIIVAGRSSRQYEDMSRIAPTIDLTMSGDDFMASFGEQHRTIGKIFGVEELVETRLEELDAAIADVQAQSGDAGRALVLMTTGAEVAAFGPGSRFGFVYDLFGYTAADPGLEQEATHGDAISFEYILETSPDVIFVVDRASAIGQTQDNAASHEILDNELVAQTPAWQNDRVVYIDSFAWYIASYGLPSYFKIAEDMAAGLP